MLYNNFGHFSSFSVPSESFFRWLVSNSIWLRFFSILKVGKHELTFKTFLGCKDVVGLSVSSILQVRKHVEVGKCASRQVQEGKCASVQEHKYTSL